MKISKKNIFKQLDQVLDPELNISIIDLGLIYDVKINKKISIIMTLTTIGCPLFSTIEDEIKNKLEEIGIDKKDVKISLTFDPPWSIEKMSPKAKAILGI